MLQTPVAVAMCPKATTPKQERCTLTKYNHVKRVAIWQSPQYSLVSSVDRVFMLSGGSQQICINLEWSFWPLNLFKINSASFNFLHIEHLI